MAHTRSLGKPQFAANAAANSLERSVAFPTRWAFYAWMFSLPFDVVTPGWLPVQLQGSLSIPRMAGILLTLCFVADPRTRPWRLPPAGLAFAAFFAVFTLSMLRGNFFNATTLFQQCQLLLLFLICYNMFSTGSATRRALYSFAVGCGVASIMILTGAVEASVTEFKTEGREFAFGADPNIFGKLLAVGAIVAIGVASIRRDRSISSLAILWGLALVSMIAVARTGSRGMTLALIVGLTTFVMRKGSLWVRLRNVFLLAAVACMAYVALAGSETLVRRWTEAIERGATSGRDMIFLESMRMTLERPLIGWGPSATAVLAVRLNLGGEVKATHNTFLAILIVTGLVGFIPFFVGYAKTAWAAWRARLGVENVLPLAIFVTLFVGDMSTGGIPDKIHWTFYGYILAAWQLAKAASANGALRGRISRS
jgi:O-antigen ligase